MQVARIAVEARRDHQRGRPVRRGDGWVGTGAEQHRHQFEIRFLGGQQERCCADAEQYVAHVDEALFLEPVLRHARVDVGAEGDQLGNEVEGDVECADRDVRFFARHDAADDCALHGQPMQRGVAGVVLVRIGTAFEQQIGQVPMGVDQRQFQRALSRGEGRTYVGAGVEQRRGGLDAPGAYGEQERIQALLGAHGEVGATGDERGDGPGVVGRGRPHQGCLTCVVDGVRIRPGVQQRTDGCGVTGSRGGHQHGFAAGDGRIGVGSRRQEPLDDGGVAIDRGEIQRRDAVAVAHCRRRTRVEEAIDQGGVVAVDGPMQGRRAVDGGLVDVGVAEHALEAGQVAGLGGFHQRRIRLVSRAVERPAHGNQGR